METPNFNQEDQPHRDHRYEDPDSSSGCGCFGLFRFKPLLSGENDAGGEKRQDLAETTATWVREKVRKARELSEVIAGPKWKNFVRKVGGYFRGNNDKKNTNARFQYDPQSYALNFDSGFGAREQQQQEENGPLLR